MITWKTAVAVMLGGAAGSLGRYLLSLLAVPISARLPVGTILINVAGSFLIGLFAQLTGPQGRYPASETFRLFVMVGVLGGFTTFSSFSLQTLELARQGAPGRALVNVLVSVALCLLAVWAGFALAGGAGPLAAGPLVPGAPRRRG